MEAATRKATRQDLSIAATIATRGALPALRPLTTPIAQTSRLLFVPTTNVSPREANWFVCSRVVYSLVVSFLFVLLDGCATMTPE